MFKHFGELANKIVSDVQIVAENNNVHVTSEHLLIEILKSLPYFCDKKLILDSLYEYIMFLEYHSDLGFTESAKGVLEYAVYEARINGQNYIRITNILSGILQDTTSFAYQVLREHRIDLHTVIGMIETHRALGCWNAGRAYHGFNNGYHDRPTDRPRHNYDS